MKKTISLFLVIMMVISLICVPVSAANTDISSYALEGYNNLQLNNGWAEVTTSDETDASGVITSTAASEETIAAGKRIATFYPWADKSTIGSSAAAYTMHFGFTVNEISDPVRLDYQYRNSSSYKTLLCLSDGKVAVGDSLDAETFVEVQAPYTLNLFMNIQTGNGYIFVNDQLMFEGNMNPNNCTQWREVRVFNLSEATNINLVTTAANASVYNAEIGMEDVVKAYMGDDIFGEEPVEPEEPEVVIPENLQPLADYALDGYLYNQIKNNWADGPVLTDETDENGVITTTATYEGTLAAGKRIATFVPWADKSTIGSSAAAYTMHFGFTVNEISDPVRLDYQYRNSSSYKTLLCLSDSKVAVGDSLDAETFVEVQAPYTLNLFMNIQTGNGYIFVNDQLMFEGNMNPNNCTQWREVRVFNLSEATNIKLVTTAANASVYNAEIGIKDVVKAYMGDDALPEEPVEPEEPEVKVPENLQGIAAYALDGYLYKQLNNSWAEVTLANSTDANGIITTTATYEGTLASGKRIASFQPWEDRQGVSENAAGAYTMHFGFTVNDITSPLTLAYKYRDGATKYQLSFSDSKVVHGGSMDGETFVEVTEPYTINIFMNIQSCEGYIFVNDELLFEGSLRNSSGDKKWQEVRVFSLEESTDISLVTTAANSSVYNADISLNDVVKAYMGNDIFDEDPVVPPVEDETIKDETGNLLYSGIKYMSDYALDGYNNKQINNNWAVSGVTRENTTDEATGVITTTASYSGTLAAGQRVATFQPWEKNKPTYTSAAGSYTMHFGFTVNEITTPLCLEYRFDASKKLISFSDSKVVWGSSMDGDRYIEVTAPYTIDIFMNIQTCKGIIFVNGEVLYDGTVVDSSKFYNSSADIKWTEVRVTNLEEATDIKLVTTAANCSIFNDSVIFENVVDYVMNREDAAKTNWLWQVDGINVGHEMMHGVVDGLCNITGNNTDGYVLTPTSINASHYGFARFFLGTDAGSALPTSTDDKILWQSFEYNPTKLTSGQLFEIRGNNAYQTLIKAVPATETDGAYLEICGNKVAISEDEFYKIDFIVNNKDYEYYIFVDGKLVGRDAIWETRQPLWNTVFSSFTEEESMTLKNVRTTVYDNAVSMQDFVKELATNVNVDVNEFVYDKDLKTLTVTATVIGNETVFDSADLVYVAYTQEGQFVASNVVETYSEDVTNITEYGRYYPHGELDITNIAEGEKLIIKAYLWDSVSGMTPITYAGQGTYTVPVTVVEEETTTE